MALSKSSSSKIQQNPWPSGQHGFSSHDQPPAADGPEQRIWDNDRVAVNYDDRGADNVLLYTRGLVKEYDGRAVVNGVDIEVKRGEIVGLLGPNGAGKTTTFYMIVGLVRPNGGQVVFDGKDATHQPMFKRARLGMGYLPQEESIFRKLTVRENILAVMETQNFTKQERKDQCDGLMEKFGISHVANNLAITLSGGEKRRLTIARSLVTEPKLLMLDEPFSGVDPIAVSEIQEIIRMLRRAGLAILITDHNVRETLSIVDRAYLIYEGKVKLEGTQEFLVNDPTAKKLYLGEDFKM
jgi:lipopolysaccharide export system ATP-binding protein